MPWNLLVMKAEVALKGFHIDCWDEGFNSRKKKTEFNFYAHTFTLLPLHLNNFL